MTNPFYSIIIPMHNEEGNVRRLHEELVPVLDALDKKWEIIYINDGSKDATLSRLLNLKNATIIDLNRQYGQATALDCGFKSAQGEIVISMDGDLQNSPHDIPKMLKILETQEVDVVCGWRKKRQDDKGIRILTRTARVFRNLIIDDKIHDTGCTLRIYRKEAVKSLDLWGEMHRYIVPLLIWKGFRITEVVVDHRPRVEGKTKYNYSKAIRGFLDLIYIWFIRKYYQRPLHVYGYIGLLFMFTGFLAESVALYGKILQHLSLNRNGWFYTGFFFITIGIIFLSFGITLDLIIKTYLNTSPFEKRYHIRKITKK